MRTTWNGSLTFGLVNIPVGLAPATKPTAKQSDVSFRLLHRECLTPIKQKRWCPTHDVELSPEEIAKGWEHAKGQFVVVEEEELGSLESSDDSKSIVISQFVDLADVDSMYRDRIYYLIPGASAAQRKPYRLLVEAMGEGSKGALGRFVRSGKESLCLVLVRGNALVLETLYLAEDVYSSAEIAEAVESVSVTEPELELAHQIITGLAGVFDPAELTSDYRSNLRTLLQAKVDGQPAPVAVEKEPELAPAGDLLGALQASLDIAKAGGKKSAAKAPAKKPRAKQPA